MLRKYINKFYFESDIFNIHPVNKITISMSVKSNRRNNQMKNECNTTSKSIPPGNITEIGTIDNKPIQPRKIFFKAIKKSIPKEIELLMNNKPSSPLPYYNPDNYYKESEFVKQQQMRKLYREKNIPQKIRESYDADMINFRKYGSAFDSDASKVKKSHFTSKSVDHNITIQNISIDNRTAKEKRVIFHQSNIFHSDNKNKENQRHLKKMIIKEEEEKNLYADYKEFVVKSKEIKEELKHKSDSIDNDIDRNDNKIKQETIDPTKYHKRSNEFKIKRQDLLDRQREKKNYLNKFLNHKISNGIIHQYEINHNDNIENDIIDMINIKKQFRSKGIDIFGEEYHDSMAFTKGKCIIKIRENANDNEQYKKIERVIEEIEGSNNVSILKTQTQLKTQGLTKGLNDTIHCKLIKTLPTPKTPNLKPNKNTPKIPPVRLNKQNERKVDSQAKSSKTSVRSKNKSVSATKENDTKC